MKATTWVVAAVMYLGAAVATWAQSALSPELQSTLRQNVFEVVIGKPKNDPLTYSKPLPVDLLPYTERTDTQYSIGTAFAIGGGRFISAAHVFALDSHSLYGAIALRDASGNIHPVGEILAYSTRRDYAVFTVPGLKATGLSLSENYQLNEPVYSVGNALGQGVVIRGGVLTSLTPEERSGAWKWLRFSAPASPGNSGGPLVEANGKVIGIVEMKSQDENLNYALPISQIDMRPVAILDVRGDYKLPNLTQSAPLKGKETFALPLAVAQLGRVMSRAAASIDNKAARTLTDGQVVTLFPNSPGSAPVLGDATFTTFPEVIGESTDRTWRIQGIQDPSTAQIGSDGSLFYGDMWDYSFYSFTKPSDTTLAQLFGNPRRLMDLILQGYPMTRTVASQDIRITSYGKPAFTKHFTDAYGRRWLAARWDIPFADLSEILLALPTPTGAVGYMAQCDYSQWKENLFDMRFLANFLFVSYQGTLRQWKTFLTDTKLRPAIFDSLSLNYSPDSSLSLDTPRFSLTYSHALLPVSAQSEMAIMPAYYRDNGRVVWAIGRVFITPSVVGRRYLAIEKAFAPGPNASDARKQMWSELSQQSYPYDHTPFWSNGVTHVDGTVAMTEGGTSIASPRFLYGLRLALSRNLTAKAARTKYELLQEGLHLKAAEVASASGGALPSASAELATIEGKTIFQAVSTNDTAAFQSFISGKRDLDAVNDNGSTPLMAALALDRTTMATELVQAGAAVNVRNRSGETPFLLALKNDDYETARMLLDQGADANVHDSHNVTPLMLAMPRRFGNLAADLIGSGVDINAVSDNHRSALLDALFNGRDSIADELIRAGARLDLTDDAGWTPLMAALRFCSSATAQLLIDQGAPLKGGRHGGWTPLNIALRYGHEHIALELIRSNPGSVNVATKKERDTPLFYAAAFGNPEIVQALLKRGADPTARSRDGRTAIMEALLRHHLAIARLLAEKITSTPGVASNGLTSLDLAFANHDSDVASALLKLSTTREVNLATSKGATPLDFAARDHAPPYLLEALIAKGAELHVQDATGWTPLMYVLRYGTGEDAGTIISHLHSAPEKTKRGWNALHVAARYRQAYIPDLIRLGLPVNGVTNAGWTPLELAAYAGDLQAVKWLVAYGADPSMKNGEGERAIDVARKRHDSGIVAYLTGLGS